MRLRLKIETTFLFWTVFCCGISMAAPNSDSVFKKRLSEVGLSYSLPNGFLDNGSNQALEKALSKEFDSVEPFVVHQMRSNNNNIVVYLDVRVLGGIDLKDPAFAAVYPIFFESNAAAYCAMVSGGNCYVLNKFPTEAVQADYNADFGMIFMAKKPDQNRLGGHKKMSVVAISKPNKGFFYITIAYDSDEDFKNNFEPIIYSLKFK